MTHLRLNIDDSFILHPVSIVNIRVIKFAVNIFIKITIKYNEYSREI